MHFLFFFWFYTLSSNSTFIIILFSTVRDQSNSAIEDVFGFVKGGDAGSSSGSLGIRDAKSYKDWGKSLKYNPALIEFEVNLPY